MLQTPEGWIDCGFKEETPTDIQPVLPPLEPLFGVTKKRMTAIPI